MANLLSSSLIGSVSVSVPLFDPDDEPVVWANRPPDGCGALRTDAEVDPIPSLGKEEEEEEEEAMRKLTMIAER